MVDGRNFAPETDILPPVQVPLKSSDFPSERAYLDLMQPTAVTDANGRALPAWCDQAIAFSA